MKNFKVIHQVENDFMKVEIIENQKLSGAKDGQTAQKLFYMEQAGIKLKNVRIILKEGAVKIESGALFFMKGKIKVATKPAKGFIKNLGSNLLSGEKMFKPEYSGKGEIWLEPSFGHFKIIELDNDEIIVDKGMFYACDSSMQVSAVSQKNLSSTMFGGEGFFQTKVKGSGIVVLNIPVPLEEVMVYQLDDEDLRVDGNYAILRRGDIKFTVKMVTKGIIGTMASGEGMLQTFSGTGEVWLAPTQAVYEDLTAEGISGIDDDGSSHTETE
ncbi:AIM24 family protein [Acidaminobacter sp. JC074]|uniref:AIM24 family protein n=1 Tax=Acidaminobacter sp. JC074 TaxID=2530199 RepID=UPI001F0D6BB4|nr:AIM24 family protein [Acidaminobacter sp. JC074]MCH4886468.1 AIM24 family protein [Acidaminobacter sp. JC074]